MQGLRLFGRLAVSACAVVLPCRAADAGVLLAYCGYVGGDAPESLPALAVDAGGSAYVATQTWSSEQTFPVRVGPDLTLDGSSDVLLAKVTSDGRGLVYAGFVGGSRNDGGSAIAVDLAGHAYVAGGTESPDLPVTVGPDLTWNGGLGGLSSPTDAFVAKVRADGTDLDYCGYIGGAGNEWAQAVTVDGAGNAFVAGNTGSDEDSFPVAIGPDLTYGGGTSDGFVAKVLADGTGLAWAGYVGGSGKDAVGEIDIDASGSAHVTGWTTSSTFPVRIGPDLTINGGDDAYVVKVAADGTGFVYGGYIGGASDDRGHGIAVGADGASYISGSTGSDQTSFPVTAASFDRTYNGGLYDAFVARVRPDGSAIDYCGYIGGAGRDEAQAIAVDAGGNAYVTGMTGSTETDGFPLLDGPGLAHAGGWDAFVAKVVTGGSTLSWSGYIGGGAIDFGSGIGVDALAAVYVAGGTQSSEVTFPVTVGPGLTFQGGPQDLFVARVVETACLLPPGPVEELRAVRGPSAADVSMSWQTDLGANGYNLWYVDRKEQVGNARLGGAGTGVTRCSTPSPAPASTCTDAGAVPRGSPAAFFYQVRVHCDASSEGP